MARRPARKPARKTSARSSAPAASAAPRGDRDKIIAAFLTLLAEKPIERIGFAAIAEASGVSLAQLRGEFPSTLAILAAHIKSVDRAVLSEDFSDVEEEPARERLFDVLMRRIEILKPHREAVRSLMRSARRNPPLALALNSLAVRSQQWMLTAAGIGASGPRAGPRGFVRRRVAHLDPRRRPGAGAHHGVARPGAGARAAFRRLDRRFVSHTGAHLPVAAAPPPRRQFGRHSGRGLSSVSRAQRSTQVVP